ncbi:putative integral membrane protein (DUF2269) [Mycobacterium sp. JS623]|uniref:DUF2269 family protein n=1 Tax=Mycobacterium sp. JS623 TaxID=212767 RepID=UPI0002A5B702|nr:DUF2269 family protein [Mycobacterium sp. JS623]AGB22221.1 putative integral membrane protein (DUF2269) [Mycobacterium sp. JS623]
MNKLLLSVHVAASIIFIGPITVAASLFPRFARQALVDGGGGSSAVAAAMHRITCVYAVLGLAVPVVGIVLAVKMGVLTDLWIVLSLVVTLGAAGVLAGLVLPAQRGLMAAITGASEKPSADQDSRLLRTARRLSMFTGVFSLLWLVVVVLMIARPGSTTGI